MGTSVSLDNKAAVLAQLERILSSPAFRNSKRYPTLLRYVVEQTLEGRTGELKERALGIDVFGRAADYDSNADPIVRVTAGEVRNRIARYYHDPGREREIRIELPAGSYVPEFQFPAAPEPPSAAAEIPPAAVPSRSGRLVSLALALALLACALLAWRPWQHAGAAEQFWAPFARDATPVTICLARAPNSARDGAHPADIGWPDVSAAVRVASVLGQFGGRFQLRQADAVNFDDLRHAPAILIGAFNDVWTLRLTDNLRFEPEQEGHTRWIADRDNPTSRAWAVDLTANGTPATRRDYAVISRLLAGRSNKPILAVAGLTGYATEIGGEFVTDPSFPALVSGKAPRGWERRNIQVVIETEVIENHSGPARILAVYVW